MEQLYVANTNRYICTYSSKRKKRTNARTRNGVRDTYSMETSTFVAGRTGVVGKFQLRGRLDLFRGS